MIADNLRAIEARIREAARRVGRDPEEIRIVAAAKGQGRAKIEEAIAAGVTIIGHNYVQEAASEKPAVMPAGMSYHMIGHLQKNKVGKAVGLFDVIETVDDGDLAAALDRRAGDANRTMGVMIQVNVGEEPQKSGVSLEEAEPLVSLVRELPNVRLMGLMTMPPFFDQPERARPFFAALRELRDRLIARGLLTAEMKELSMGMTGDFEVAVEEGATLVRIGTALFGPR
ncbi:MAG: YggS family pyridoxal phosphate-dependent enzyme [Desulfomonilaceae bacterium]